MNQEFLDKLYATFKVEAGEHIAKMTSILLTMESNLKKGESESGEKLETIYREAHSLKGAARAVGLFQIEIVLQSLETLFSMVKKDNYQLQISDFDIIYKIIDLVTEYIEENEELKKYDIEDEIRLVNEKLSSLVKGIQENQLQQLETSVEETTGAHQVLENDSQKVSQEKSDGVKTGQNVSKEIQASNNLTSGKSKSQDTLPKVAKTDHVLINSKQKKALNQTIRISVEKLDDLLIKTEELLSVKLVVYQIESELKHLANNLDALILRNDKNLENLNEIIKQSRVNFKGIQKQSDLSKILEIYDNSKNEIIKHRRSLKKLLQISRQGTLLTSRSFDEINETVKSAVMLPFSFVFDLLPKMLRDLSKDLSKEVDVEISGSEIEIDRRILEEIKDPLIHILRNSIDHGIESPSVRLSAGKPITGKISIVVEEIDGNFVVLSISDDGAGFSKEKLKKKALEYGLINQADADDLPDTDAFNLVFLSGVSTSAVITDISGRGLGMSIVKEKVEKLKGSVSIVSEQGKGSTIKLNLPITISTVRGLVCGLKEQKYIFPVSAIKQALRVKTDSIKIIEEKLTTLYNGKPLNLISLAEVFGFGITGKDFFQKYVNLIILKSREKMLGVIVDEIINEQEIIIKPFSPPLISVRFFIGASILGNGELVPVVDSNALINIQNYSGSADEQQFFNFRQKKNYKLLVVDDSLTSRILIKDILETSGFIVETAADGKEAFNKIITTNYDLIVSDIEMPVMNGLELTTKIRAEEKFSKLPVVLVTGLASNEDKQKGIDAGANAYLMKKSFDQSNLLEVVNSLISKQ